MKRQSFFASLIKLDPATGRRLLKSLLTLLFITMLLVPSQDLQAQVPLASVQLKTIKGTLVSYASLTQKDSLVLVCFWATSSESSIEELNAINAKFESWQASAKFRMLAVAVDEGKDANRVKPTINMYGWLFDVYTDAEGDLRKALNGNDPPQSMILKNGSIVYRQSGFEPGSENYLLHKIITLSREHN